MVGNNSAFGSSAKAPRTRLSEIGQNKQALAPPGERHTAFTAELLGVVHRGIPGGGALLDLDDLYRHVRLSMRAKGWPEPQNGTARPLAGSP